MKRYIKSAKTTEDYENMGVFDKDQMRWIRQGLEQGFDVSVYADPKYNRDQMEEIYFGLEAGLDISWYADPKYDDNQMAWIRYGLKDGLDVSEYADPKYDWNQMRAIYFSLETKNKPSLTNWKSLVNTLQSESEDGIDPLYENTAAGEILTSIQKTVEYDLGIWLEGSVQGGEGSLEFYSTGDDSTLASNYDYQTFNNETIDLAIESKNKTEFKKKYKAYLENILDEYAYV